MKEGKKGRGGEGKKGKGKEGRKEEVSEGGKQKNAVELSSITLGF